MTTVTSHIKTNDKSIIHLVYVLAAGLMLILIFILLSFATSKNNEEKLHNKIKDYHMKSIQLALASVDEIHKTDKWFKEFKNDSKTLPYLGLHPHDRANRTTEVLRTNAEIISRIQNQFNSPEFNVIINNINSTTEALAKTLKETTKYTHTKGMYVHTHETISISTNELFFPLIASYRQLKKMHEINLRKMSKNRSLLESGNTLLMLMTVLLLFITGFIILFLVTKKIGITLNKQTELFNALSTSQDSLDKAQEITHIGSWDWNILTGDLDWSDEMYRIFGIEPQSFDATYEGFLKTVHPEDRQLVNAAVKTSINTVDQAFNTEYRIVRSDGKIRVVHAQGIVYKDEDMKPYRMIGTVLDITERTRSEKELNTFKTTLDMTLDCVFMFDPITLKLFYVNEGAADQLGYSIDELHEMTPFDMKPQFDEKTFREMIAPLKSGEKSSLNFETIHRHKDGHDIHVEIFLQLVAPDKDSARFVAMVRDISERRAIENELKVYRTHLETLVNERTKKLEETRDELILSERMATLGKLTATVSHELRNPLGAMRPSLHIIKNKKKGIDDRHIQEAIDRVDRNITRCDHIIDELLDFTRSSEPVIQHIVLDDWVGLLLDEQIIPENIILKRDLNVEQSTISFDPDRMRRAVINILDNAFHAAVAENENRSSDSDSLVVTLSTRTVNNLIEITITDTGAGIADDVLPKIFEPLFSTKGFGVGLGMSIVKQILEQHQGNIFVDTRAGEGTSVTLSFPVKIDKGAAA